MRYLLLPLLLGAFPCCRACAAADPGLLAHWSFDEGSGSTVHDSVGGCDGSIHGATWVRSATGYALQFDGVDDFVDCGSPAALSPAGAVSVEVWLRPDRVPAVGEPGVIGKAYHNYVLTYYTDGKCWWYCGNSERNLKSSVTPGVWHHVVGTMGEGAMRLYVDGVLCGTAPAGAKPLAATEPFFFGTSRGAVQWTRNATFGGQIDEARVYGRALTAEEVLAHYRTTRLTHQPEVRAFAYYSSGQVEVETQLRGLGELPAGARLRARLLRPGQAKALATGESGGLASYGRAHLVLAAHGLPAGHYLVRVQVCEARGKAFGGPAEAEVTWPVAPSWPVRDGNLRVLNNLVTELRQVKGLRGRSTVPFTNPREGWVFVASTASGAGEVVVSCAGAGAAAELIRQAPGKTPVAEAMRRLPAGRHELRVACEGGAVCQALVVRAVPEIGYCRVDSGPQLQAYGPCDWPFLEKHILPNINLAVSRGAAAERERWAQWKASGRRWLVETPAPGLGKTEGVSAEEVYRQWASCPGATEPLLDGLIVDEFGAGDEPIWQSWQEGLRRLRDTPAFAGKVFYPYCGPLHGAKGSRDFAQTVLESNWAVALERYLPEEHTEAEARGAIHSSVVRAVQDWEQAQPGVTRRTLIVWGFMISAPPETTNTDPAVDYKAFMDLQLHALANEPSLFGLYGVTSYLSAYSDEETIRWLGRLYRHYCLEGRTDRLTREYELKYLANPDFEEGHRGWEVQAGAPDGVGTGTMPGLSYLQGRYPQTPRGDSFLLLSRSAGATNAVRQQVRGLQPGRLYSLKMISADYDDLQRGVSPLKKLPVEVTVQGVEVLPERTFQYPFRSCYSHTVGPFNRENPASLNMHNVLFRARGATALVRIAETPQGEPGDRIACNFLELQPYFEGK